MWRLRMPGFNHSVWTEPSEREDWRVNAFPILSPFIFPYLSNMITFIILYYSLLLRLHHYTCRVTQCLQNPYLRNINGISVAWSLHNKDIIIYVIRFSYSLELLQPSLEASYTRYAPTNNKFKLTFCILVLSSLLSFSVSYWIIIVITAYFIVFSSVFSCYVVNLRLSNVIYYYNLFHLISLHLLLKDSEGNITNQLVNKGTKIAKIIQKLK